MDDERAPKRGGPSSPSAVDSPATPRAKRALRLPDGPPPPSLPPSPPSPKGRGNLPEPNEVVPQAQTKALVGVVPCAGDSTVVPAQLRNISEKVTPGACFCGCTSGVKRIEGYWYCKDCRIDYLSESESESEDLEDNSSLSLGSEPELGHTDVTSPHEEEGAGPSGLLTCQLCLNRLPWLWDARRSICRRCSATHMRAWVLYEFRREFHERREKKKKG